LKKGGGVLNLKKRERDQKGRKTSKKGKKRGPRIQKRCALTLDPPKPVGKAKKRIQPEGGGKRRMIAGGARR